MRVRCESECVAEVHSLHTNLHTNQCHFATTTLNIIMNLSNNSTSRRIAAQEWLSENPTEKTTVASRIFNVPSTIIRSVNSRPKVRRHGGQNAILSEYQITALAKYIRESYNAGYPTTK